ncbi:MAG: carboxypeptidase regulatory-like domain-containing protein [Methanosarcinaceae archaeon]|nr:carboxypeptidase regulatory-like domain-containing protein [Methanosarcinaceae archaeon]MDF1534497.1 carboxypeptidase regulatory-like domain-containing protein [Methanosarcinaceae archaeon]
MVNNKKLFQNDSAIELPINIVVMLVVGMVALAALIAIIPPPTKNMSVNIDESGIQGALKSGNTVIVDALTAQNALTLVVKITANDPDGNPVRDANVVLRGLGGVATNTTDINGIATLITDAAQVKLGANQNEGTMDLTITANGFYDYDKTDAVMIVKTK